MLVEASLIYRVRFSIARAIQKTLYSKPKREGGMGGERNLMDVVASTCLSMWAEADHYEIKARLVYITAPG